MFSFHADELIGRDMSPKMKWQRQGTDGSAVTPASGFVHVIRRLICPVASRASQEQLYIKGLRRDVHF